ncbi:MAG: 30S ribosomal protein S20 [Candidatus Omnitrophica bacterium]|nr:30S ribosomal protein S20 [Candidatus Omnitrophota bacterium]
MPIKHAALKQIRKDRRHHQHNQAIQSELRTLTKRFLGLVNEKKFEDAKQLIIQIAKKYDRAASRRVIHRNTASRFKSRLALRLNKLQ